MAKMYHQDLRGKMTYEGPMVEGGDADRCPKCETSLVRYKGRMECGRCDYVKEESGKDA